MQSTNCEASHYVTFHLLPLLAAVSVTEIYVHTVNLNVVLESELYSIHPVGPFLSWTLGVLLDNETRNQMLLCAPDIGVTPERERFMNLLQAKMILIQF